MNMNNIMFITAVSEIKNYCEQSQYTKHIFERNRSSQQKLLRRTQNVFGRYHSNECCPTLSRIMLRNVFEKRLRVFTP